MRPVDWLIVLVIGLQVLGGLSQGFLRSALSLAGIVAGLSLAAWHYATIAAFFLPLVRVGAVANAIGFLGIVFVVMGLAQLAGGFLSEAARGMGLGLADRLAGGALGFLQGFVLITVVVWAAVAFFPHAAWLHNARLPREFFGACRLSTHFSPQELADRVLQGLHALEAETANWVQ